MAEWYVQNEHGQEEGPFSVAEMKQKAQAGIIRPDVLVRKGHEGKWVKAGKVKGLFPEAVVEDSIAAWIGTPERSGWDMPLESPDVTVSPPLPPPNENEPPAVSEAESKPAPAEPTATKRENQSKGQPTQWYVTIEGEQRGPLTDAEIRRWVSQGKVQSDTFVRKGADGEWSPAKSLEGLFDATSVLTADEQDAKAGNYTGKEECGSPCATMLENQSLDGINVSLGGLLVLGFVVVAVTAAQTPGQMEVLGYMFGWSFTGGLLGAIIGSLKEATLTGLLLGFSFGPLGAVAAFAVDGRLRCGNCGGKLNGKPSTCPYCQIRLVAKEKGRGESAPINSEAEEAGQLVEEKRGGQGGETVPASSEAEEADQFSDQIFTALSVGAILFVIVFVLVMGVSSRH